MPSFSLFHLRPRDVVHGNVVFKEIRFLHSPVVLGQLDRKDDAGDEEHYAPSQTEPEGIQRFHHVCADDDVNRV